MTRVQAHSAPLYARGVRPIQIGAPDIRSAGFRSAEHARALAVAERAPQSGDQGFIDGVLEPGDGGDESEFDFAFEARVFEGPVIYAIDDRRDYGEVRVRAIGCV
jgi:hypothetical protein